MAYDTQNSSAPYDLNPTSDYEVKDDDFTSTATNQWAYVAQSGTPDLGLCLTSWRIGNKGHSCVQVEAYFTRNMARDSTNDALYDIDMDYSDHVVSIRMGAAGESDAVPFQHS